MSMSEELDAKRITLPMLLQSFLFSFILFHWVNAPRKRWLGWTMRVAFCIVLLLPVLGLLTTRS